MLESLALVRRRNSPQGSPIRNGRPVATVAAVIVFGLTGAACGGGDENAAGTRPKDARAETQGAVQQITVDLREANRSGQSGTATLTDKGESDSGISLGTDVVLEVSPPKRFPGDVQIPAIHSAPCATIRGRRGFEELSVTEVQPLTEVRAGRSESTAARSLAELTAGGFSITVHQPTPPFIAVVCGDISSR
jgi:hypothetical protein